MIYALFSKRDNKIAWSLVPIVFGLIVFYVSMFIMMPAVRAEISLPPNAYISLYSSLGDTPLDIARTLVLNPLKVITLVITPKK